MKFPSTEQECKQSAADFYSINGFPGIVAAVDGSHIPIKKPSQEPDCWVNRKGIHSINVTATVDAKNRFTYYSIGCPGSFHDQRVYRLSTLETVVNSLPTNYHIVGDSAYTSGTHLMVPFRDTGNLTDLQRRYNHMHSTNRIIVEHTFGIWKMKFQRVMYPLQVKSWERATRIIECTMLIHNFIIDQETAESGVIQSTVINLPVDKDERRNMIALMLDT